MPRDYSRGGGGGDLRFAPVCLSVCLSARLSSFTVYSFQRVFLKPCILFVDIMKMCMWSFVGDKIILTELRPFKHSHFGFAL